MKIMLHHLRVIIQSLQVSGEGKGNSKRLTTNKKIPSNMSAAMNLGRIIKPREALVGEKHVMFCSTIRTIRATVAGSSP